MLNHISRRCLIEFCAGGLMFKLPESNLQYVTSITFLLATYSKYMSAAKHSFNCGSLLVTPASLKNLAKKQVTPKRRRIVTFLTNFKSCFSVKFRIYLVLAIKFLNFSILKYYILVLNFYIKIILVCFYNFTLFIQNSNSKP